jgi:hypothetical protein
LSEETDLLPLVFPDAEPRQDDLGVPPAANEATHDFVAREPADAPSSAVQESVADGPMFHESETAREPARREAPETTTQNEVEDPSRPKRSGWWRRARATFVGE